MSDTGRTLPPTPRKLRQARRKGDVPRARDLGAAASWIAVCCVLALNAPRAVSSLGSLAARAFTTTPSQHEPSLAGLVPLAFESLAAALLPPLVACFAAVLLAGFLFTGPTFSWYAVAPRLDRLAPAAGLKRLFSGRRLFTCGRDVVKLALVLVLGALALRSAIRPAFAAPSLDPAAAGIVMRVTLVNFASIIGAGAVAFAFLDVAWSRHSWLARQRMTQRELRQELRETEGDPSLRGARRRQHREIAEHRMIDDVRRATVILVNPTHVAVALRWDEDGMDAPTVVATGSRALARRIIREARRSAVPVIHDAPLARTLVDLEPGEVIPEDLYEAVAAVLRALADDERAVP
ncbi:MAG: EscU/YscU/HrcU family type III secretion system export apparatus switch protein [Deltaproteobacteria bacterium]|nr:EscU/YscU/HrcU family type III secretion system export apparatus switch protein [Deltaproteobacteria bacterium]